MSRQDAPGFINRERVVLRLPHRLEAVDQLVRGLAEHERARDLGEEAAGAVVLDQQHEMVAGFERAALEVARRERRLLADRRGVAEEDALLAAEHPAGVLGERGHVVVGHAGLDCRSDLREDRILHLAAALDQADLLLALDRLEAVDELGRVDEM